MRYRLFYRLKVKLSVFIFLSLLLIGPARAEKINTDTKNRFRIAIFREEKFLPLGITDSLSPKWLFDNLSKDFSVLYLDSTKLSDKKYLNPENFDLLILPYGEAFPYEAFQNIKEYLFEGGGLLNIAGRPFWVPMVKIEDKWQRLDIENPYKEFLAPLGIKYYESAEDDNIGLIVTASLSFSPVQPTHGNVFPYRIPARDFYSLDSAPGVFVKSWRNPYIKESKDMPKKWCLIGARDEDQPLNPQNPEAEKALMQIMDYLSYPIIIYELESNLASYRQGEEVKIFLKVANSGRFKDGGIVEFEFVDKNKKVVYSKTKSIELSPGQRIGLSEQWKPEKFKSSFYKVRATLKKNSRVFDKEENGFVVFDEVVLRDGPTIRIEDKGFIINGNKFPILGTNYYESKLGELVWVRPNLLRIREDFRAMKDMGINFVRIHYHHSKWFRDYFSNVVKEDLDPYLEIVDTTALPSERSLRILDAIIQLTQEQGLIFCMDIFSLVPEEMGDPIGWLGLRERIVDKEKILVQKKFVELLARRYKDVPGIVWDLWNEPRLDEEDYELLREWAKETKAVFGKNGDNHLVTIGGDISLELLDVLDYGCIHTYEPGEFDSMQDLSKPIIFNEVWNPAGGNLEEETRQAEELRKDFNDFLDSGFAGFIPWQWTRQARLWNNTSEPERWDDELGLCVREDGALKPAGKAYGTLIKSTK